MKAKDVAQQLNEIVRNDGIQDAWDDLTARMVAGATNEELLPDAEELLARLATAVQPVGSEYLNFLVTSIGKRVADQHIRKPESARAAVLEAERAWRGFHSRLDPVVQRVLNEDALKNAVISLSPDVARLAWADFVAPRSPRLH